VPGVKPTLGSLATLINIDERLVGLLYRPTKDSTEQQIQDVLDSPEKLNLLFTLLERLNRSLHLVKITPVEVSLGTPRDE